MRSPLTLALVLIASVSSAQDRVILGTVVDQPGAPVVRARILGIDPRAGTAVAATDTDDRGAFSLTAPAQVRSLQIIKSGFARTTVSISTAVQGPITLTPAAVLTGRVLDQNGAPMAGTFIDVQQVGADGKPMPASEVAHAQIDERGEVRIGGMAGGRYLVAAQRIGPEERADRVSVTVDVRAGEQLDFGDLRVPNTRCLATTLALPLANARRYIVRGRVVTPESIPLACTLVRLVAAERVSAAWTDARGRFEFQTIPGDSFTVETGLPPFYPTPTRRPIDVPAATGTERRIPVLDDVELELKPAGMMAGAVYDDRGEPLAYATVSASRVTTVDGRPTAARGRDQVQTDDRGMFRIMGLQTGRYLVAATANGATTSSYVSATPTGRLPSYYPGVSDIRLATMVDVSAGVVRDDVTFAVSEREGVTVSGTVVTDAGEPLDGSFISLAPSARSGAMVSSLSQELFFHGRFAFAHVAPGDYVIKVVQHGATYEFGRALITVDDRTPPPVTIRTTQGRSVRGTIATADGGELPRGLNVSLVPIEDDDAAAGPIMGPEVSRVQPPDWRRANVIGLQRFTLLNPPDGWFLKSVRIGGRETVDDPFDFGFETEPITGVEIVVSPAGATVTGGLRDNRGPRGYTVVVFSTRPEDWYSRSPRVRFSASGRDGRFTVRGLPPGTYYAAAIQQSSEATDRGSWQDSVALERLAATSNRLTLDEGQVRTLELSNPRTLEP